MIGGLQKFKLMVLMIRKRGRYLAERGAIKSSVFLHSFQTPYLTYEPEGGRRLGFICTIRMIPPTRPLFYISARKATSVVRKEPYYLCSHPFT